jgi:hypothetical protein
MLRSFAGRVLGILMLVLVLYPLFPAFPPAVAAATAGEAVLRGGGGRRPHPHG